MQDYVTGNSSEELTVEDVGRDDRCALDMLDEGDYARASDEVTAALVELFAQARR